MKKDLYFIVLIIIALFPISINGQVTRDEPYTVMEVYTNPDIVAGESIQVEGYYTNNNIDLLIYFYGDFKKDRPFSPHTILTLTGVAPPASAENGGFILVEGVVTFAPRTDPYNPEDSLMAYIDVASVTTVFPPPAAPGSPGYDKKDTLPNEEENQDERGNRNGDCDPCKFAFLLSGGADAENNHAKYWENLVALYKFKVDSLGYCDSNVFVHYYNGVPRDGRIPAGRVIAADSSKIDSSFQVISDRVAACNDAGTPATFQKMVTNHGEEDGDICLLDDEVLKPGHLKDLQQKVIDSCCRTVYDEFLQCYGGKVVDELDSLDNKNKATIYINSNANDQCGYSPHDTVHPYLRAKIASLDTGDSYPDAVVNAKLAYDAYLQTLVDECHEALEEWRAPPPHPEAPAQIALWTADSLELANAICKSRNVTIVPFTEYCQWQEFVVPPGGQLKVDIEGKSNTCGNVTVYKENESGEKTRVKVWNWNHPGSYRYEEGNNQRVVNGDATNSTTFWIHNDNDTSKLTVHALANQDLPESASNEWFYPGFSCGGIDYGGYEFSPITAVTYVIGGVDMLNFNLAALPSLLGPGYVQDFNFSFQVDPFDPFWSQVELILHVSAVTDPDDLFIFSPSGSIPETFVSIPEPGKYVVPLGDFTLGGFTYGNIILTPASGMLLELDAWGIRSTYGLPDPPTTTWMGLASDNWDDPLNWTDGVPGPYHHAIITLVEGGFIPRIEYDITLWKLTVTEAASIITAPGVYIQVAGGSE